MLYIKLDRLDLLDSLIGIIICVSFPDRNAIMFPFKSSCSSCCHLQLLHTPHVLGHILILKYRNLHMLLLQLASLSLHPAVKLQKKSN